MHPDTPVLDLISCVTRLFWEGTLATCWAVDHIYGPEPPTPADLKREAEHDELRLAFPLIDREGTIALHAKPPPDAEASTVGHPPVSASNPLRAEVPAPRVHRVSSPS